MKFRKDRDNGDRREDVFALIGNSIFTPSVLCTRRVIHQTPDGDVSSSLINDIVPTHLTPVNCLHSIKVIMEEWELREKSEINLKGSERKGRS
jgi:hypothetical protein